VKECTLDVTLTMAGAAMEEMAGIQVPLDYGDVAGEYAASLSEAGLYAARDRGLIELTGDDRVTWLNNLVTNAVRTLTAGEGNYAFVLDRAGRILFDLDLLVRPDSMRLNIDRRFLPKALGHFDRYLVSEDVHVVDRTAEFEYLALLGPQATGITDALGASHAAAMPALASTLVPLAGKYRLLVRHDFAGVFGAEFCVESADAPACWQQLMELGRSVGLRPVGRTAVRTLQIEAGIPIFGEDIDESILPAETLQLDRAVSFTKGCYLGQEVIERMRSRAAAPKSRLVGLRLAVTPGEIPPGTALQIAGETVGRLTSATYSPRLKTTVALGYLKSSHAASGHQVQLATQPPAEAEVIDLPIRA
jgi:folate-binding protein YgfZ